MKKTLGRISSRTTVSFLFMPIGEEGKKEKVSLIV